MFLDHFRKWFVLLLGALTVSVSAVELQSVKNWLALPKGTSCTEDNGVLVFNTGNTKHMHPYCRIPEGAFKSVRALQFDIQYHSQTQTDKLSSAVLLYNKAQKKNIRFSFKVNAPDIWQTVTVKLASPQINMAELKGWQFAFASRANNLTVRIKNLKYLDETDVSSKSVPAGSGKKAEKNIPAKVSAAVDLQSVKNWLALPKETSCTADDDTLKFASGDSAKQMFPYCRIPLGSFSAVQTLQFDIKYHCQAQTDKLNFAVLLYNRKQKKSSRFNFKVNAPDSWQTVRVKLVHPEINMAELKSWQFAFSGPNPDFSVWVKNFRCFDKAGKEIFFQSKKKSSNAALVPIGTPDAFAALPGVPHDYPFRAKGLADGQKITWRIVDFSGKETVCRGTTTIRDQKCKVNVSLPAGFYELHTDTTKQVFGISVLNLPENAPDHFFSMEALLYTKDDEEQKSCLRFLAKRHINSVRDWTVFHQLHPAPGKYVGSKRRDVLFKRMAEHQIQALYAFGTFSSWQGPITLRKRARALPKTLIGLDTAMLDMYNHRRASAIMFQTLNEFDAIEIPAECFMAPIRTAAWAMRNHPEFLLGGSAFCKPAPSPSLMHSMANHMLDYIDMFAIHFYRAPEELLERVEKYRQVMQKHPAKAWMPIWITESGKPWVRGRSSKDSNTYNHSVIDNHHPQPAEDTQSALWITANAIEAKTMGIERFFPFVMGFFQENNSNFGMMDYYRTPLRSLHCYSFAAGLLAGKEYIGDPAKRSQKQKMEHIFRDRKHAVAVFYSGMDSHRETYCEADVSRFPAGKGFSMAGEELQSQNGTLRFKGGLAYWVFPAEKLTSAMVNSSTRNMTLHQGAKTYKKVPRFNTPVIIRYKFWQTEEPHYNQFAHFLESENCVFQLTNLDDKEHDFYPAVTLTEGVTLKNKLPEKITIPARSEKELVLEIDPGKVKSFELRLKDAKTSASEIIVPFIPAKNLRTVTVDWKRWRANSAGTQTLTFDKSRNALKVHDDFRNKKDPEAAHWSFPELLLSASEKASDLTAVSFDIMIDPACYDTNAQKWHMLQASGSRFKVADYFNCFGIDDNWKSFTMYVSGNEPRSVIRIGMATEADQLTYYIRNIRLHFGN